MPVPILLAVVDSIVFTLWWGRAYMCRPALFPFWVALCLRKYDLVPVWMSTRRARSPGVHAGRNSNARGSRGRAKSE